MYTLTCRKLRFQISFFFQFICDKCDLYISIVSRNVPTWTVCYNYNLFRGLLFVIIYLISIVTA